MFLQNIVLRMMKKYFVKIVSLQKIYYNGK